MLNSTTKAKDIKKPYPNKLVAVYFLYNIGGLSTLRKKPDMDGTTRANIKPGMLVNIILKKDQRSGVLTKGIVQDILTSAPKHHNGIKVRLQDGQVGRVQEILDDNEVDS